MRVKNRILGHLQKFNSLWGCTLPLAVYSTRSWQQQRGQPANPQGNTMATPTLQQLENRLVACNNATAKLVGQIAATKAEIAACPNLQCQAAENANAFATGGTRNSNWVPRFGSCWSRQMLPYVQSQPYPQLYVAQNIHAICSSWGDDFKRYAVVAIAESVGLSNHAPTQQAIVEFFGPAATG